MIKVKDGYAKLVGTTASGSASHILLSNGGVKAVSDFALKSELPDVSKYLPLTGGTLILENGDSFKIKRNKSNSYGSYIAYETNDGMLGRLGMYKENVEVYFGSLTDKSYNILHEGNFNSYAPKLDGTGASGTWNINISGDADTLDGEHGSWYQNHVHSFDIVNISALYGTGASTNVNTLKYGMLYNYGSSGYWVNAPVGMLYGLILNLKNSNTYDLAGQLAWDINHNSTTDTTRYLWWRATDDGTWTEAKWHRIAYAEEIPTVTNYYWANVPISSEANATTKPTFSNTIVNGVLTVNGGMKTLAINHNHTLTTPWNDFIACLNPNLTATYHTAHITFGRTYDSKNVGYIGFKYAGSASNSNMVTIGLHSVDNVLNILASGNVGIGTLTPSLKLDVVGSIQSSDTVYGKAVTVVGDSTTPYLPNINWFDLTKNVGFHVSYRLNETTKPLRFYYKNGDTFNLLLDIESSGLIKLKNNIVFTGSVGSGAGTYLAGTGTDGLFLAANESGKKVFLESTNQSSPWFRNKNGDYAIWHSGNDGSGSGLDADLLDGYLASDLVFHKKYSSLSALPSGSTGWYRIGYIYDTDGSPSIFMVRAYAHSSAIFTVTKGYSTSGSITQLAYCSSINGSYCCIQGARLLSDGAVEILLTKPSANNGTYVNIHISMYNANNKKLEGSLTLNSGSPTVIQSMSFVSASMLATHFYESSDIKLKTNIQKILNSDKMPIIKEFDWKSDGTHSYGLIAQELEEMGYPELVSGEEDGHKTVKYSAALSLIIGKLLVKIQEIEKENKELRDEINNLKTNKLWQS